MVEPDIMVDKGGLLVRLVLLDRVESDGVLEDRGIEVVDAVERKTVEADGDDSRDGSHVQETLGRRLKTRGLIYPGNNPDRAMPKYQMAAAAERSVLRRSTLGQVSGLEASG